MQPEITSSAMSLSPQESFEPSSVCAVILNNQAVELFEQERYYEATKMFRQAVNSFITMMPVEAGEDDPMNGSSTSTADNDSPRVAIQTKIQTWSERPRCSSAEGDTIFIHQRVAYLRYDYFCPDLYPLYSAFILYNLALSYQLHAMTLRKVSMVGDNPIVINNTQHDGKAHKLYNMSLAALQASHYSDGVLLTVLLNNTGQLLYQQCMTFEASRCFRVVRDLMNASDTKNLFEQRDYCGLYLNSLMHSDTASAA